MISDVLCLCALSKANFISGFQSIHVTWAWLITLPGHNMSLDYGHVTQLNILFLSEIILGILFKK